ncbi:MAG: histidine-type phosphatase [Chitinophagaceae bacterium]
MKKIGFALLFALALIGAANAQNCSTGFLGSKTLYTAQGINTPALKNYNAVFINHVGRHGARHLTSDVATSEIYQLVAKADSAGALTATGKTLKEKIHKLAVIEKPLVKSISYEGRLEQQGLADRMYNNYTHLFNDTATVINIAYTKEIRTLQTSDAFMQELQTKIKAPAVSKRINDTTLRFYDIAPSYLFYKKKGPWMASYQQLKNDLHYTALTSSIAQIFFTKEWVAHMSEADLDEFTAGLYGFISICYSIENEIKAAGYTVSDLDMQQYLTCDQLTALGKIDNAEDYYLKGPAENPDGIQVSIAAPLLADFVATTDAYIKTKSVNLQLRFSHAETIAPFAAILSLTTASTKTGNPVTIDKVWNAGKVIPLSSNIQWVLYQKKGSKDYLIKFLLNEKETAITGLSTKTFPYYNWAQVRNFYLKKLQQFQLMPAGNYLEYLRKAE